jgi:hypothetical protein
VTFLIPEIIFDLTLVLSLHVFLLRMLFKARAFQDLNIDLPDKLYSLKVLKGLGEQELLLREEINDEFVFCQAVREVDSIQIAHKIQATTDWIQYQMKKGGQILGIKQVVKTYVLRDSCAKELNKSCTY